MISSGSSATDAPETSCIGVGRRCLSYNTGGGVRMEHFVLLLVLTGFTCILFSFFFFSAPHAQPLNFQPTLSSYNSFRKKSEKGEVTSNELRVFYKQYPHLKTAEVYAIVSYHNVKMRLPKFLNHFDQLLWSDNRLHLVITSLETDRDDVISEVKRMSKESQDRVSQLFYHETKFSRGRLCNHGAAFVQKYLNDEATIYITDIDVFNSIAFFERCRKGAVFGKRVYYPVVWSQNKPDTPDQVIGQLNPEKEFTSIHLSGKYKGFWRDFGYGMLCINVRDFLQLHGFPEFESWGAEDGQLNEKIRKNNLRIERRKDVGILHIWHAQNCSQKAQRTDPAQGDVLKSCLDSQQKIDNS